LNIKELDEWVEGLSQIQRPSQPTEKCPDKIKGKIYVGVRNPLFGRTSLHMIFVPYIRLSIARSIDPEETTLGEKEGKRGRRWITLGGAVAYPDKHTAATD